MFEVTLLAVEYIRDVPVELTRRAISMGLLCSGAVVGLRVDAGGKPVLIELRLDDDEQAKLLNPGCVLPLEEKLEVYRLHEVWRKYLCVKGGLDDENPVSDSKEVGAKPVPVPLEFNSKKK